jgi:surface antigen
MKKMRKRQDGHFLCPAILSCLLVVVAGSSVKADYLRDWELRAFISDRTLNGVTVRDRERWHVEIAGDGEFKMQHTNGRFDRGTWTVSGAKITFMFRRGDPTCRQLYFSGEQMEWKECGSGTTSSIIVSPNYNPSQYAGLNQRKAREAATALGTVQGMVRGIPLPRDGVGGLIVQTVDQLIDRKIARYLSQAGQQQHALAIKRSLESGQSQEWSIGRENGSVAPTGRRYVDAQGRTCEDRDEQVRIDGQHIQKLGTYCWDSEGKLDKVATVSFIRIADAAECCPDTARASYIGHAPYNRKVADGRPPGRNG